MSPCAPRGAHIHRPSSTGSPWPSMLCTPKVPSVTSRRMAQWLHTAVRPTWGLTGRTLRGGEVTEGPGGSCGGPGPVSRVRPGCGSETLHHCRPDIQPQVAFSAQTKTGESGTSNSL